MVTTLVSGVRSVEALRNYLDNLYLPFYACYQFEWIIEAWMAELAFAFHPMWSIVLHER